MKVAIIHDSLTVFGGAEQVLNQLLSIFPQADFFTSLASTQLLKKIKTNPQTKIRYSQLSKWQLAIKHPSFFKPYFYHHYWSSLNLDSYDLVISSSHSFCANWVKVKGKHVSYIHTPPRFLYEGVNDQSWLKKKPWSWIFYPYFQSLRYFDYQKIQKIDLLICNSKNVQKRIKHYYHRSAQIIYPPITNWSQNTTTATNKLKNKKYYLFFSRLVKQKGIKLVVETFNQLNKNLIVVGTGKEESKLKKIAQKNIKFLGFVKKNELQTVIQNAQALIYPTIDEDFGLIPIEVLSLGIAIIAHYSGGPKETLNKNCAVFFREYNKNGLIKAINKFENKQFKKIDCLKQAQKFTKHNFNQEFLKIIKKYVN